MKRFLAAILCLAVVFGFAACADKPNAEAQLAEGRLAAIEKVIKAEAKIDESNDIFSGEVIDKSLVGTFNGYEILPVALKAAGLQRDYAAYKGMLDGYLADSFITQDSLSAMGLGTAVKLVTAYKACGGNPEQAGAAKLNLVKAITDQTITDVYGYTNALTAVGGADYNVPAATIDAYIDGILAAQIYADGWGYAALDVDTTAMALAALAPYLAREKVKTAVDKAVVALSKVQQPSGAFLGYAGESSASTAEVIVALCALKVDPKTDGRFVSEDGKTTLNGLELFSREGAYSAAIGDENYDQYSTLSAAKAYGAYHKFVLSGKGLYDFK